MVLSYMQQSYSVYIHNLSSKMDLVSSKYEQLKPDRGLHSSFNSFIKQSSKCVQAAR